MLFSTMHFTDAIRMLSNSPGVTDWVDIVEQHGLVGAKTIHGTYKCAGTTINIDVFGCPVTLTEQEQQIILVEVTYALQDLKVLTNKTEQLRRNIWVDCMKPYITTIKEHNVIRFEGPAPERANMSEAVKAASQSMSCKWATMMGPDVYATHFADPVEDVGLDVYIARFTTVILCTQTETYGSVRKFLFDSGDTDNDDALLWFIRYIDIELEAPVLRVSAMRREFKITFIAE